MKVYFMCLSLNYLKCSERDPRTLKIPKHGQLSTAQELEAFVSLGTGSWRLLTDPKIDGG
jgi:hypothetical protein